MCDEFTGATFLRDRELGIRGTGQRIVRQGVIINNDFPYNWTSNVRRKVYQRLGDECVDEEKERAARCNVAPYYIKPIVDYSCLAVEIIEKIHDECEAIYIKIRTGIGKYVELAVMNNSIRLSMYVTDSINDPKQISMLQRSGEREFYDFITNWHYNAPFFSSHRFMHMHYCIQYCKRYCSACYRVACKCSIEECDVI